MERKKTAAKADPDICVICGKDRNTPLEFCGGCGRPTGWITVDESESYAQGEVSLVADDIRREIINIINEPVEKRIIKALDEICGKNEIPF